MMSQRQSGDRRGAHILVVDDDPQFLTLMELLLTTEGYSVEVAATLVEWEAKLRGTRPDVLVCDLSLAGAPQFAVLDRLAAIPDTDRIPVIICSGAVHDIDEATARLAGRPSTVLAKPFDIDQVFACLDRLLGSR
jgi:twitching motility two-component system response regulator PilH